MEGSTAGRPEQHDEIHGIDAESPVAAAAPLLSSPPSSQQQQQQHRPPRASLGLETPRGGNESIEEEEEDLATARHCLYASHFLSAWGARAWEFAAGLALFFPAGGGGAALARLSNRGDFRCGHVRIRQ